MVAYMVYVCILMKAVYCKYVTVITGMRSAFVQWVLVKKEAFGQGFVLGGAYFPHEASKYAQGDMFEDLLFDLIELNGQYDLPIILIGDFNARTGTLDDCGPPDDAHVPKTTCQDISLFDSAHAISLLGIDLNRYSQDSIASHHGYQLIQCLRATDLRIVNGRFGSDTGIGRFTCTNANGQSVIDYMIMSTCLLPNVTSFEVDVLDKCLSDVHCPLPMNIAFKRENPHPDTVANSCDGSHQPLCGAAGRPVLHTKWNCKMAELFEGSFDEASIRALTEELDKTTDNLHTTSTDTLNELTGKLCETMLLPARAHGMCKQKIQRNHKQRSATAYDNKPWFDSACVARRKEYLSAKDKFKLNRSGEDKAYVMELAKSYKRFIHKAKIKYNEVIHQKLRQVRFHNTKEYLLGHFEETNTKQGPACHSFT